MVLAVLPIACAAPADDVEDTGGAMTGTRARHAVPPKNPGPIAYVVMNTVGGLENHCTATLIAPRALVTAASCVDHVAWAPASDTTGHGAGFVFFGADPSEIGYGKPVDPNINISIVAAIELHPTWRTLTPAARRAAPDTPERVAGDAFDLAVLLLEDNARVEPLGIDWTIAQGGPLERGATFELVGFGGTADTLAPVLPRRAIRVPLPNEWNVLPLPVATVPALKGVSGSDHGGPLLAAAGATRRVVGVRARDQRIDDCQRKPGCRTGESTTFTLLGPSRAFIEGVLARARR